MQASGIDIVDDSPPSPPETSRGKRRLPRPFAFTRKALQLWIRKWRMRILTIVICLRPSEKKIPPSGSEASNSGSQTSSPRPNTASTQHSAFPEGVPSTPHESSKTSTPSNAGGSVSPPPSTTKSDPGPPSKPTSSKISRRPFTAKQLARKRVLRRSVLKGYPGSGSKGTLERSQRARRNSDSTGQREVARFSSLSCCGESPEVDLEELNRLLREKKASDRAQKLLSWRKDERDRAKRVAVRCRTSLGIYSIRDLGQNVGRGLGAYIWARPEVMLYSFHPSKHKYIATAYAKRPRLHWNMQKPVNDDEILWRNSLRAYHTIGKKTPAHHYNKHFGRDPAGYSLPTSNEGFAAEISSKLPRQGPTSGRQGKIKKYGTPFSQLNRQKQDVRTTKYDATGISQSGTVHHANRDASPSSSQGQTRYQGREAHEEAWKPRNQVAGQFLNPNSKLDAARQSESSDPGYFSSSQSPRSPRHCQRNTAKIDLDLYSNKHMKCAKPKLQPVTRKNISPLNVKRPQREGKRRHSLEKPLAKRIILRAPKRGGTPDITVKKLYLVSDSPHGRKARRSPKTKAQQKPTALGDFYQHSRIKAKDAATTNSSKGSSEGNPCTPRTEVHLVSSPQFANLKGHKSPSNDDSQDEQAEQEPYQDNELNKGIPSTLTKEEPFTPSLRFENLKGESNHVSQVKDEQAEQVIQKPPYEDNELNTGNPSTLTKEVLFASSPHFENLTSDMSPSNDDYEVKTDHSEKTVEKPLYQDKELMTYDLEAVATQLKDEPVFVMNVDSTTLDPIVVMNGSFGDGKSKGTEALQEDSRVFGDTDLSDGKEDKDMLPSKTPSSESCDAHTESISQTKFRTEDEPDQVHTTVKADLLADHSSDRLATFTADLDTRQHGESAVERDKIEESSREVAHWNSNSETYHKRSFSEGSYARYSFLAGDLAFSQKKVKPGAEQIQPLTFMNRPEKPRMRDESSQVDLQREEVPDRPRQVSHETETDVSDKDEQTQTSSNPDLEDKADPYVRPVARLSLNDNGVPFSKPGLYQVLEPPEDPAAGGKILATSLIKRASITGENSQVPSSINPASPSSKHSQDTSPSPEKIVTFSSDSSGFSSDDVTTSKEIPDAQEIPDAPKDLHLRHGHLRQGKRVLVRSSLILGGVKDFGPGKQPTRSSRILDGIEDDLRQADIGGRRPSKIRIHSFLRSMTQRSRSVELNNIILQELARKSPGLMELNDLDHSDSADIESSLTTMSSDGPPGTPVSDSLTRGSLSTLEDTSSAGNKAFTTEAHVGTPSHGTGGKSSPSFDDRTSLHREETHVRTQQHVLEVPQSSDNRYSSKEPEGSYSLNELTFARTPEDEEDRNFSSLSSVSGEDPADRRIPTRSRGSRVILRSSVMLGAVKDYGPGKNPVRSSRILDLSGTEESELERFNRKRSSNVRIHSFLHSTSHRGSSVELNNLILQELAKNPALRDRITLQSDSEEKNSNTPSRSSSLGYASPPSPTDEARRDSDSHSQSLVLMERDSRGSRRVTLDAETFLNHVFSLRSEVPGTELFHSSDVEKTYLPQTVRGSQTPGAVASGDRQDSLSGDTNPRHGILQTIITQSTFAESGETGSSMELNSFKWKHLNRDSQDTEQPSATTAEHQNQRMKPIFASARETTSQTDEDRVDRDSLTATHPFTYQSNADDHESLVLSPYQIIASSEQCPQPKLPTWMERWKSDRFADFPPAPLPTTSRNDGNDSPPPTPADGPPSTPPHQIEFLQAFWNKKT